MPRRPKPAKPRRGRPPKADSRTVSVGLRLSLVEAAALDAARGPKERVDWIRATILEAAERWRDTLRR
jgi:hypothetical protein